MKVLSLRVLFVLLVNIVYARNFLRDLVDQIVKVENIKFVVFFDPNITEYRFYDFSVPKMIFDLKGTDYPILKMHHSTNILTVWYLYSGTSKTEDFNKIIRKLLLFNMDSKFLVIVESYDEGLNTSLKLREFNILNVLIVFEDNLFTYTPFPNFTIKSVKATDKLYPRKSSNIHSNNITMSLKNFPPRSVRINSSKSFGTAVDLMETFTNQINGTFNPKQTDENHDDMKDLANGKVDFITFSEMFISENKTEAFINFQNISTVLNIVKVIIIVPLPKKMHLKPFNPVVWFIIFALICYEATLITVILKRLGRPEFNFSYNFGNILRSFLAQPFVYTRAKFIRGLANFYFWSIFSGFILTVWYSAVLGSFITTSVREKPINTIEDIKAVNLKILMPQQEARYMKYIPQIETFRSIFEQKPLYLYFIHKFNLEDKYGYVDISDIWEYLVVPQMKHFQDIRFKQLDFSLTTIATYYNINYDSLYKFEFNRFIHRVKDVGLYQFWNKKFFNDMLKNKKFKKIPKRIAERAEPLGIDFYLICFHHWGISLFFSGIVFLIELFYDIYKRKDDIQLVGYFYIE